MVRCRQCGHYQIAFISTMLTLEDADFESFCRHVSYKSRHALSSLNQDAKIIMVATPTPGVHLILTPGEFKALEEMLEAADSESKAQALLCLFRTP